MSQEDGTTTATDQESDANTDTTNTAATDNDQESKSFDADYVKKIRDEAAQFRTQLRDAQTKLKDIEDRDKSEGEKLTERVNDAEQRASRAEIRLARVDAAIKKKLPIEFADRLIGDTPEDLEKDAERLLRALGATGGGFDQGARRTAHAAVDIDSAIRSAAGRA